MSQRTPAESERQPKTYRLSAKALLSLPFRLCNPPPAVGKVRSCGVTPVFKVRLADVLDRKHLPPLGLKDFEEWLLYVEMSPENLYFILWLREYTIKYRQWEAASKSRRQEVPVYLGVWPSHNSTQLAMFYARAKQTFLTPNANYELNLPSDVLAPFHTSNGSPHPDPAVFNNVAVQVQKMLDESLQRFVTAQFNNVGNNRVLCGMMAGIFCCLVGALFPLLFTILRGHSRWLRLTAFPGLWLGFSLLITSINGICLGVYIFGDLRQLRKFELSRPAISRPQPFYSSRRTPVAAMSINRPLSEDAPMEEEVVGSDGEGSIRSASTSSEEMSCDIQISPAYYDTDPVEGPAVSPISYTEKNQSGSDSDSEVDYPATALFIHPFDDSSCDDMSTCDTPQSTSFPSPRDKKRLPEEMQRVSEFDFGALPRKQGTVLPTLPPPQIEEAAARIIVVPAAAEDNGISPKAFIRRLQARCNIKRWLVVSEHSPPAADGFISKQFKKVKAVPAFASPLTKILSPVVVRGQWEIVVRSMVMAFLLAWIVIGCLLAVPVR